MRPSTIAREINNKIKEIDKELEKNLSQSTIIPEYTKKEAHQLMCDIAINAFYIMQKMPVINKQLKKDRLDFIKIIESTTKKIQTLMFDILWNYKKEIPEHIFDTLDSIFRKLVSLYNFIKQ